MQADLVRANHERSFRKVLHTQCSSSILEHFFFTCKQKKGAHVADECLHSPTFLRTVVISLGLATRFHLKTKYCQSTSILAACWSTFVMFLDEYIGFYWGGVE